MFESKLDLSRGWIAYLKYGNVVEEGNFCLKEKYGTLIENMKKVDLAIYGQANSVWGIGSVWRTDKNGLEGKEVWGFLEDTIEKTIKRGFDEPNHIIHRQKGNMHLLELSVGGCHPDAPTHSFEYKIKIKQKA